MTDTKMTITMKNNLKMVIPLKYDTETDEWVIRLTTEALNDVVIYFNNGFYSLEDTCPISISTL